jgi:hypothetical protein
MTEAEWKECADPGKILQNLPEQSVTARKWRLYAVGCCRRIWNLFPQSDRNAVEVAERFADGDATLSDVTAAKGAIVGSNVTHASVEVCNPDARHAAFLATGGTLSVEVLDKLPKFNRTQWNAACAVVSQQQSILVRCVFGNPFQPLPPKKGKKKWKESLRFWLEWNAGAVLALAQAIYNDRAFDRLPILADALEDAGCTEQSILEHCRGGGEHVRGCWVVDLLTGRT